MFKKTRKFTLIELIVVIAVLGVLSAIVIPNINDFKHKATYTAYVSDIKVVQTAVDMYCLDNNGLYPTFEQPTRGKPGVIDFNLLMVDYLRDLPEIEGANWWIDSLGIVYSSTADAFDTVNVNAGEISWEGNENTLIRIYEISEESTGAVAKNPFLYIGETMDNKFENIDIDPNKDYVLEAIDIYDFSTPKFSVDYVEKDSYNQGPVIRLTTDLIKPSTSTNFVWTYEYSDAENDTVVEEKWILDGVISSTPPDGKLPEGEHTISLSVLDSAGSLSNKIQKTFVVVKNTAPVVTITTSTENIDSDTSIVWQFSFKDAEKHSVVASEWTLNNVKYDAPPNGKLDIGDYTITLRVQDELGCWSELVSKTFTVAQKPDYKTVAPMNLDQYSNKNKSVVLENVSSAGLISIRLNATSTVNQVQPDQGATIKIYENNILKSTKFLLGTGVFSTPTYTYSPTEDNVTIKITFESKDCGTNAFTEIHYYGY